MYRACFTAGDYRYSRKVVIVGISPRIDGRQRSLGFVLATIF
jgi:hypothetical protein